MVIGSQLIFFRSLPSTNTRAAHLLKNQDIPEGTIVYTDFQSAGRGQISNRWESQDSKNLLFSIILFPSMINPGDQFLISMTISLGICDFLKRHAQDCSIKWPNDIYISNDKIAGILIENSIMGNEIENTIAGIGININQNKFFSDAPNPVSLNMVTGNEYDLPNCLNQLTKNLDERYKQLKAGNYTQIKEEYISQLFRLKEWNTYSDQTGPYTGRIKSVTDNGSLQIESQTGKINEYSFKEVDFIL